MSGLSNHDRLRLTARWSRPPDRVRVMEECVLLHYPGGAVHVSRGNWRVFRPFGAEEAALAEGCGVVEIAREAARGGVTPVPRADTTKPVREAQAAFRRRLMAAMASSGERAST